MAEEARKVITRIGEEFVIIQPSNPTTGYDWEVDFDKSLVELRETTYKASTKRFGGGGERIFRFAAVGRGGSVIRMRYRRPWEEQPLKEAVYHVRIDQGDAVNNRLLPVSYAGSYALVALLGYRSNARNNVEVDAEVIGHLGELGQKSSRWDSECGRTWVDYGAWRCLAQ